MHLISAAINMSTLIATDDRNLSKVYTRLHQKKNSRKKRVKRQPSNFKGKLNDQLESCKRQEEGTFSLRTIFFALFVLRSNDHDERSQNFVIYQGNQTSLRTFVICALLRFQCKNRTAVRVEMFTDRSLFD